MPIQLEADPAAQPRIPPRKRSRARFLLLLLATPLLLLAVPVAFSFFGPFVLETDSAGLVMFTRSSAFQRGGYEAAAETGYRSHTLYVPLGPRIWAVGVERWDSAASYSAVMEQPPARGLRVTWRPE